MPGAKTVDLCYRFDRVWDAISLVLERAQWNVVKMDRVSGLFQVKLNMGLITNVEDLYIRLERISDNSTRVWVGKTPTYPLSDWG